MIYGLLLTSARSGELILSTVEFQQYNRSVSTAILRVNHQIHDEAIEMLYVLNRAVIPFQFASWPRQIRKPVLIRTDLSGRHDLALRSGTYHFVGRKGVIYESMLKRLANIEIVLSNCDGGFIGRSNKLLLDLLRNLIKILAEDDAAPEVGKTSEKKTLRLTWRRMYRGGDSPERFYKFIIIQFSMRGILKDLQSLAKVRNVVLEDEVPSKLREEIYQRLPAEESVGSGLERD